LDLVRVALRGACRLAAQRFNAAVYDRLSEDFSGYLVTDENPCDMTAAEMAACWPFGSRAPFEVFSERRWVHDVVGIYRAGWWGMSGALQDWALGSANAYCLDAAWWVPAGGCGLGVEILGSRYGRPLSVMRGAA
jgi:hypothetical protein